MKNIDFATVLNHWKIYDENERWSLKSLFLQGRNEEVATSEQFYDFLSRRIGKDCLKTGASR